MVPYKLEQRWEILRHYFLRSRQKKKKIIFWDEAHFDIGGYVNIQNESLFGAHFGRDT